MYDTIQAELSTLRKDTAFQASLPSIWPGKFNHNPDDPVYAGRAVYTQHLWRLVYDPASLNTDYAASWCLRHRTPRA